jgi:hypothetical protein
MLVAEGRMSGTFSLDPTNALVKIIMVSRETMSVVIGDAEEDAVRRAPVRKEYHGRPRTRRMRPTSHIAGGREIAGEMAVFTRVLARQIQKRPQSERAVAIRAATHLLRTGRIRLRGSYSRGPLPGNERQRETLYEHGVRTKGGYLRDHIESDVEIAEGRVVGHLISRASYSKYVEFPTSRTAAQPFLLPAWKTAQKKLIVRLQKAMR